MAGFCHYSCPLVNYSDGRVQLWPILCKFEKNFSLFGKAVLVPIRSIIKLCKDVDDYLPVLLPRSDHILRRAAPCNTHLDNESSEISFPFPRVGSW